MSDLLQVFLCHSSEDKTQIRKLNKKLYDAGIDVWLDEMKILPGQDWQLEINKAVRSSHIVLVCLSQNSISKLGFFQKEMKNALDIAKEQPEGTIFLIPVKLEECEVPSAFSRLQWVNLFEENGFIKLIEALKTRASSLNLANVTMPLNILSTNTMTKNEIVDFVNRQKNDDHLNDAHTIIYKNLPYSLDSKISGRWKGDWKSEDGGERGAINLNIYKIQNDIVGFTNLQNSSLTAFGDIFFKGEIIQEKVKISLLLFDNEIPLNGALEEEEGRLVIKGDYSIPGYDWGSYYLTQTIEKQA